MAEYPRTKGAKTLLYAQIVSGITANPADYPSGAGQPFNLTAFNALITAKNTAVATASADRAAAEVSLAAENDSYADCDEEARRLWDLGIATHGRNSPKLAAIGAGQTDAVSGPPGQPRTLEAILQGPGTILLDWKNPIGGRVSYYRVLRRKRSIPGIQEEDWGAWQMTTIPSELMITGLERGVEYDFAVIAVNAGGESIMSNSVTVVL